MTIESKKFPLIILTLVLSVTFALALHTLTPSTYDVALGFSFNETVTTSVFNITVNNTYAGAVANITQVNITLPSTFTFIPSSQGQGENETVAIFTNTTTILTWTNATADWFLINGTEASVGNWTYFWFNASASTPGTYNITVTTANGTTNFAQNISVQINDTTAPFNISFDGVTEIANGNLSQNYIMVNVTANDTDGTYGGALANITYYLHNASGLLNTTITKTNSALINFTGLIDGIYYINATANDTLGNTNSTGTGTRTVTIDTTAPTTSAACTPAAATLNEVVTCACTASDATSGVASSSASTTPSTESTGSYSYSCTATDYAGNAAAAITATYTVSGGSSGSSGSTVTTFWSKGTTTLTAEQFTASFTKEMQAKQRLKLKVGTSDHYVGIIELTATTATVNISSDPQQAIMKIGDERKFEVSGDNNYDIFVKLNSITDNKANITIQSINELITSESAATQDALDEAGTKEKTGAETETIEEGIFSKTIWIIGIIVAIVLIIIIILYAKKK